MHLSARARVCAGPGLRGPGSAGPRVWPVTATPGELAATIARRLCRTGALGTEAEIAYGHYTGRLVGDSLDKCGCAPHARAPRSRIRDYRTG